MVDRLLVVGGGFAGTAAAFGLARQGFPVTLLEHRAGSSEWSSGLGFGQRPRELALWEDFSRELKLWNEGASGRHVTSEGVITEATVADRWLLDLAPLEGKRVGVVDLGRGDMDAGLLVRTLKAEPFARERALLFEAVAVQGFQSVHERWFPAVDFAALHDDPERLDWLAMRLRGHSGFGGWLLGPWLGVSALGSEMLTERLGVPVGEIGSRPGEAAGLRWKRARDRLLSAMGVEVTEFELMSVAVEESSVRLDGRGGDGNQRWLTAPGVVLATGGMAAGGIVVTGSLARPEGLAVRLGYTAPLELELEGTLLEGEYQGLPGSFHEDFQALERLGVRHLRSGRRMRLEIAGDMVAERPRNLVEAVTSGLSAAERLGQSLSFQR